MESLLVNISFFKTFYITQKIQKNMSKKIKTCKSNITYISSIIIQDKIFGYVHIFFIINTYIIEHKNNAVIYMIKRVSHVKLNQNLFSTLYS